MYENANDVVSSDRLSHFTMVDYLKLAIACLDQVEIDGCERKIVSVIKELQEIEAENS